MRGLVVKVLHGIARYCMVLHGIVWYCMELHGIVWYSIVVLVVSK